jgi:hypothetical protein
MEYRFASSSSLLAERWFQPAARHPNFQSSLQGMNSIGDQIVIEIAGSDTNVPAVWVHYLVRGHLIKMQLISASNHKVGN